MVVWGRNADAQVFYTSCPVRALGIKSRTTADLPVVRRSRAAQARWSVPLPLQQGVQHVSSFVNRSTGANTIVAHTTAGGLQIGAKAPETGLWTWRSVTLPPAEVTNPADRITSYTTRIDLADDRNQVAPGVPLAITAASVTGVYANHLYYVIGPRPTHIATDHTGTVTLVEAMPRLTGTRFTAQVAGTTRAEPVNPMDKAFRKASDLQSVAQLRGATVTSYVNGKKAPIRKLLKPGIDEGHAASRWPTSTSAAPPSTPTPDKVTRPQDSWPPRRWSRAVRGAPTRPSSGRVTSFSTWKRTRRRGSCAGPSPGRVGESFWEMMVRWFEGAWEFVVKIGEAIYRCILEVVEDIVSAIRWVFDKIVKAIEDLIEFLQYLFEWDDLKRTKDVVKNVVLVALNHQVTEIVGRPRQPRPIDRRPDRRPGRLGRPRPQTGETGPTGGRRVEHERE